MNIFLTRPKHIKIDTIRQYKYFIAKIVDEFHSDDLFHIFNHCITQVIEFIEKIQNINSRASAYSRVFAISRHYNIQLLDINREIYAEKMQIAGQEQEKLKNKCTFGLPEFDIDYKKLKQIVLSCKPPLYATREHIITSFYTLFPPRRTGDFCNFKIFLQNVDDSTQKNYCVFNTDNISVNISDFKTANRYGDFKFIINKKNPIYKIISTYVSNNGKLHCFNMESRAMSSFIKHSFSVITGYPLTSNHLRHLACNDFYSNSPGKKKVIDFCYAMGHSTETSQSYRMGEN